MNEAGVLGAFVHAFGRIVAMMQFNMYHYYTVDEHLIRCIGTLNEIARADNPEVSLASELIKTIQPQHYPVLAVALFLHDIAKGRVEDHSIAGARLARRLGPRLGLSAADTELVAWLVEVHLVMSTVAQSRDLSDRKTIENFAAVVQSLERLKLLTILTTADIRAVGPGVWNGWKAQLMRTLYYETEPVLTGGFSEVNRAQRVAAAQAEFRAALSDWPADTLDRYIERHYPAYWLKVDLAHKLGHARFVRATEAAGKKLATAVGFRCGARRHRAHRIRAGSSMAAYRSSPAPARSAAPTSSMRRSTPRPMGWRSTQSRCHANSNVTRMKRAARRGSAMPSRKRCVAS